MKHYKHHQQHKRATTTLASSSTNEVSSHSRLLWEEIIYPMKKKKTLINFPSLLDALVLLLTVWVWVGKDARYHKFMQRYLVKYSTGFWRIHSIMMKCRLSSAHKHINNSFLSFSFFKNSPPEKIKSPKKKKKSSQGSWD